MTPSRRRQANPNLGAYFGIVASARMSLVVGLAMFEQLGWQQTSLAQAMILVPLVLYLGIAFADHGLQLLGRGSVANRCIGGRPARQALLRCLVVVAGHGL